MKRIGMIVLVCLVTLCASNAFGQTRRRTTSSRRTRPAAAAKTQAVPAQGAASRVAEQIKSLGRFLYLYGPISKELASNEAAAQNNPSSSATEALRQNRAKLREAFHNYRVEMEALETTFSGSSELRPFYTRLLGVAASAAQAEERVASGRYDEAGRNLLDVMNRLTDVLLEMQAR